VQARLVEVAAVFHEHRTPFAHRTILGRRVAVRDDNRGGDAVATRGEREALAVVAAGRADYPLR